MNLTRSQLEILRHTAHRAAGGFYCGGGPDMDALVAAGLMEFAGRKSFVPDPYYRITAIGREALRDATSTLSVEEMVSRLATRGLLPCEHNLNLWQCADGEQWGAAVTTPYPEHNAEALGDSLAEALRNLMIKTNRAADAQQ